MPVPLLHVWAHGLSGAFSPAPCWHLPVLRPAYLSSSPVFYSPFYRRNKTELIGRTRPRRGVESGCGTLPKQDVPKMHNMSITVAAHGVTLSPITGLKAMSELQMKPRTHRQVL